MSKKRAIPPIPQGNNPRQGFDNALKENLEVIMGQRGDTIAPLDAAASSATIVAKVNEIIARLQ